MAKVYLEHGDVERLEKAAADIRDRLLIRVLFRLGCRVSEVLGITAEDIDLADGTVTIQHLKTRINLSCPRCGSRLGRSHTFCSMCGSKVEERLAEEREHRRVRRLPVDRETLDMLGDYIGRGGLVMKGGRQFIFAISRGQAWRVVREAARNAGLPQLCQWA